jgi:hypothetical protein
MSKVVKQILGESRPAIFRLPLTENAKPVITQDRIVKGADMVCPHCREIIHEKGLGYRQEDNVHFHGKCGGEIELPHPTDAQIEVLERGWGVRYDKATRKFTALVSRDGKMVDPETGV